MITLSNWRLPAMTDPLGRHWNQPKDLRYRVGLFTTHATISEADWKQLSRYETSMPSGVYPGKVWRSGGYLCWYGPDRRIFEHGRWKDVCSIGCLRALIQGPGTNVTYRPAAS